MFSGGKTTFRCTPVFNKAGFNLSVVFPQLNMGLTEISRSGFKQYKSSMLIPLLYVLGCFRNWWVYFGGDSFSQRIGKIR